MKVRWRCLAYAALAVWTLLSYVVLAYGAPQDAVVCIRSHGCSGTVVYTAPGRTLILTCGHAFEGRDRYKRILVEAPHHAPGARVSAAPRLIAIEYNKHGNGDLALVELRAGPLPYVCKVGQLNTRPSKCLSAGYDEMRKPQTLRWATATGTRGYWTYTRERPWHGRSGGALIDWQSQSLVGVVSGYSGPPTRAETYPGANGIYVSLPAIHRFLAAYGREALPGGAVAPAPVRPPPPYYTPQPRYAQPTPWTPGCPGGS